ncbi:uncharacterized protein YraI [Agrobacterium vitis]|nr:uncharacterized protein YraI [Agrobacterium vitis]
MRHALLLAAAIASVTLLVNTSAQASSFTAVEINLRAGPSTRYPSLDVLPEGTPLHIVGCTKGYRWCDVQAAARRGWVSGAYIDVEHESQRMRVPAYVHVVHEPVIPTVSFSINSYWSDHYADRDFYDDIDTWDDVDWEDEPPPPEWDPSW